MMGYGRRWGVRQYVIAHLAVLVLGGLAVLAFHAFGQPLSRGDRGYYSAPQGVGPSPTCYGHGVHACATATP